MQMGKLRLLLAVVTIMVVADALWQPMVLVMVQFFPATFFAVLYPIADTLDLAHSGFVILTMIVFSVWIHTAGQNLVDASYEDLEFTPGSRIWWFAVPIANLFKPYQGMRELWNASRGESDYTAGSGLVATWWGLWLVSGFVSYFGAMAAKEGSTVGLWAGSAADIALAFVALTMIHGITRAQSSLTEQGIAEVFA
jgi:hypothetical protein